MNLDIILHKWLRIPYTLHVTGFLSPKRPKATVILIHGIGDSAKSWEKLTAMLPEDIRVIGVDLLGFGHSPKPTWATYNAKTQARSVSATLLKLHLRQQPIIVGHSLGSLVAVEVAKRYSLIARRLILCSPPFYEQTTAKRRLLKRDQLLRNVYQRARKYPQTLETLSPLIAKLKLTTRTLDAHSINAGLYVNVLESSIINQTSLEDAASLKLPITIFYGTLDPVVIGSHIKKLAMNNTNVTAKKIVTGHVMKDWYTKLVAEEINEIIARR